MCLRIPIKSRSMLDVLSILMNVLQYWTLSKIYGENWWYFRNININNYLNIVHGFIRNIQGQDKLKDEIKF